MNNLTDDITRLCGEIASLRDSRAALMSSLAEGREEMQDAVSRMMAGFGEARAEMAKQTQADLGDFVNQVKEAVTELREKVVAMQGAFREDLAGAHQAWHGGGPTPRRASAPAGPSARAEEPAAETAPRAKKRKR